MAVILSVICYSATRDITGSLLMAGVTAAVGLLVGLAWFATVAARIVRQGDVIVVLRAFDELHIPIGAVVSKKVSTIRVSRAVYVRLEVEGRHLPIYLQFVVMNESNVGDYDATVAALRHLLSLSTDKT